MSGAMGFGVVFLLITGITLVFPVLAPGFLLYDLLFIETEITSFILGIFGEALLKSIINGLFWGLCFLVIYRWGYRASRRVILPASSPSPAGARETRRVEAKKQPSIRENLVERSVMLEGVMKEMDLEREIVCYALQRISEIEKEGKISEEQRVRLMSNYGERMEKINETILKIEMSTLHELEGMQEDILKQSSDLNQEIEEIRSYTETKPVWEERRKGIFVLLPVFGAILFFLLAHIFPWIVGVIVNGGSAMIACIGVILVVYAILSQ